MAKRRLNKKVLLVGSAVFAVVILLLILVILRLSQSPDKFIEYGDAALKAAREASDEDTKAEQYGAAKRNYFKANSLAKSDLAKIEILFKLADLYIETDQWPKVLGCWRNVIKLDPTNVEARFGQLNYFYALADSGARGAWQEVGSQASELIEVAENKSLLMKDAAELDVFRALEKVASGRRLGPHLYLVRGRANLELTRMGTAADRDESLDLAMDDLKQVQELERDNVDAYLHLAQAIITRGEIFLSRGEPGEREKAIESALEVLEQAVTAASDDPKAHRSLLSTRLALARRGGTVPAEEQVQALEPEFLAFVKRFPSSAEAFAALAGFYQLRLENLEKAVEAAEKAVELEAGNLTYVMSAAGLHYRRFSIYGQREEIDKAIEEAKHALTLPETQDKPGPRQWANRMSRISVYDFLAKCYISQLMEPGYAKTDVQRQEVLTSAEEAVREIEQLFGIGEEPQVVKWRGMLDLVKGDRNAAIRKLYAAYEQIKATKPSDGPWPPDPQFAHLCYILAGVFENTSEVGAAAEFMAGALYSGIVETKPEAILDNTEVLLRLRRWPDAVSTIDVFEQNFGSNERSHTLRIKALIGAHQFEDAEKEIAQREANHTDTIKLKQTLVQARISQIQNALLQKQIKESAPTVFQSLKTPGKPADEPEGSEQLLTAQLNNYRAEMAGLVEKLLEREPNAVSEGSVIVVINNYMAEGKASEAESLIGRFLTHFPNSTAILLYKQVLSEPNPGEISRQRRRDIEEQVLSNISDPAQQAVNLGRLYHSYNELEKATAEFKKVFGAGPLPEGVVEEPAFERKPELTESRRVAAAYLFEIALTTNDFETAENIAETGRRENLDDCEGKFYAARLAMARGNYSDALTAVDECLKQRPIFSRGFLLRSRVNKVLGNEHASVEDIQKASSLNPLDGTIARELALLLYSRNRKLGDNVSWDQVIEANRALQKAISLNPRDLQLQSFYAEYISSDQPSNALAIRQHLQKVAPSVDNALLLGRMAMRMAVSETDAKEKSALFDIAASAIEQAKALGPDSRSVLEAQAEYYRLTDQAEKAREMLAQAQDLELLWGHYFKLGRFEDARTVLEGLYKADPGDSNMARGLLIISEKTRDKEAIKKYSEELLQLEDSVDNRLIQIQSFLRVGLIKEAEGKLQSFKEKHPEEPRGTLLEAWLVMRQGRLTEAVELINRNLQSNQNDATAWRLRGQANLLRANYSQAVDDLKKSKSLSPEFVTRFTLARAYLGANREEDAITELKSMLADPKISAESALSKQGPRELLERVYVRTGRKEALRGFYQETLEQLPDNARWYNRAGAFALRQREFDRAEQLYGQALLKAEKNTKDNATALDGYLQALLLEAGTPKAGGRGWQPEKLDKVFEEARKHVDTDLAPIAYLRIAEAKIKLGDKASAVQYCREGLSKAFVMLDEDLAIKLLKRMYSLLDPEEISTYCQEKLQANPDSLVANLTMFNLMKFNGQYNEAIGYIDKCQELAGSDEARRVNYVMQRIGVLELAYNKTSDNSYLKRIATEYESLLAKMPNNTVVLNNLAYALARSNDRLADALKHSERACEIQPNNPGFLDTYAYVLHRSGNSTKADELMQAALQQYEQDEISAPWDVYEHLGMIKEELGAKTEALNAYERALELGADAAPEVARERIKAAIERLSR
ncbi:MAG: tetratricopeptide repeat protein [Planctomycetota bacterium]|jgi:tetratricopeptide (TPR) repeat protein